MTEHNSTTKIHGFTTANTHARVVELDPNDPQTPLKIAINSLIREYMSTTMSRQDFADKMFNDICVPFGFKEMSRQNIHDWFLMDRVPRDEKFRIALLCLDSMELRGQDTSKYAAVREFNEKMVALINGEEEVED